MKTVFVFAGTRPEIIKMAPVVRELRARQEKSQNRAWQVHFCFSGQHIELAVPFLKFFDVAPDSQLDLMASGQSLGQLTSRAASQFDALLAKHPEACAALVQGDTTTAFVAALSAFYHRIPVGHVEAGLRTSSIAEPFPEELNRRLISRVASWHYAPTIQAHETLLAERTPVSTVMVTGNTGIDALLWTAAKDQKPANPVLKKLTRRTVLVTAHRRENIGEPLENITGALRTLAKKLPDIDFVLPVHRNPKVVETINKNLAGLANFHLTDPLEYGDLVWLMKRAELILSDSGGIQEEAPSLAKPVLVLRNETERPEAVAYGTSIIVGSDQERIISTALEFLSGTRRLSLSGMVNPYGDGKAASHIVTHLLSVLGLK